MTERIGTERNQTHTIIYIDIAAMTCLKLKEERLVSFLTSLLEIYDD